MTGSVTFSTAIGGDGSTVTDDNNATTGLRDGGWRTRFVPCFTNQVAIANYVVSVSGGAGDDAAAAAASAVAAGSSATSAAASYDSFDDRYLGSKTSDPSVDNDGNTLLVGALYWNSSSSVMKVWTGSAWVNPNPAAGYLALSGGTMTGAITFAAGQTISGYLPTTGGTMTGNIVFNSGQSLSATSLKSATTDIAISSATAPTVGQTLVATSSTTATWQTTSSSAGNHVVIVHTSNGYGSTNTKIRRFTTTQSNVGTAISYTDSATLGALFTINETGFYAISYTDGTDTVGASFGISLNSTQLTTNFSSITATNKLAGAMMFLAGGYNYASVTVLLTAGDLVRPHSNGTNANSGSADNLFSIRKVST